MSGASAPGAGSSDTAVVRATRALAARLVARYPAEFRRRYADAVIQHTTDLARDIQRRRGSATLLALWPRLFWDLRRAALARPGAATVRLPEGRRMQIVETMLQDLRFARRAMAHRPGGTALAVLILAIGIGASVAMFSVVDAVVLRPLPYPDSDRITSLYLSIDQWRDNPSLASRWRRTRWEYQEFVDWRARQQSFVHAGLVGRAGATLAGFDVAERVRLGLAGTELFEVFGATPLTGRLFEEQDVQNPAVVVVSHEFAERRLAGAAAAIGQGIVLDDAAYTVIGVLPPGFVVSRLAADVWIPIFDNRPGGYFAGNTGDPNHVFEAIGLLRDGINPEPAAEEITLLLQSIAGEDHFTEHTGTVVPRLLDETQNVRSPMLLLLGAVLLLLLVACANVATVLLGQAIDRRQEIAVRAAIGAGRGRIARQLLTESALLGLIAAAIGLVLARAGVAALSALAPPYLPRVDAVGLDVRAAAFAVCISILASLLFGLAPALSLGRERLARAMGAARSGNVAGRRMQNAVIVGEIALATLLLVGAGLLVRSFARLNAVDPGFDAEHVVMLQLAVNSGDFRTPEGNFDDGAMRARFDEISAAIKTLPGVRDVAVAQSPPFSFFSANNNIVPEGHEPPPGEFWLADRRFVQPGYFEVMAMPLLDGRFLEPRDNRPDAASVVVVTRGLADRFWPGESAVGKRLRWWEQESVIVGVVADVREFGLDQRPEMQFYAAQAPFGQAGGFLMIATGDAETAIPALRDVAVRAAPNSPIVRLERVEEAIAGSLDAARFRTLLMSLFAVIAATLSVSGLYGVTSRAVAARAREIGLRVALGADRVQVISMVLRGGVVLALTGAAIGIGLSMAGTRLLESFLYDVEPNDPLILAAIAGVVTAMALLASLVPSLRASRVDPVEVLRADA